MGKDKFVQDASNHNVLIIDLFSCKQLADVLRQDNFIWTRLFKY